MTQFIQAVKAGEVPEDIVSPNYAMRQHGVARSTVHMAVSMGSTASTISASAVRNE